MFVSIYLDMFNLNRSRKDFKEILELFTTEAMHNIKIGKKFKNLVAPPTIKKNSCFNFFLFHKWILDFFQTLSWQTLLNNFAKGAF